MTIDVTAWSMTSDRTPESAHRAADSSMEVWQLSWLPDRQLTRDQARAGMELDELLGDPKAVDDPAAMVRMTNYASALGVTLTEAVVLLARRMAARLAPPAEPAPGERSVRPHQHGHAIDPPFVRG
ncbi:hypothetical protein [Nocardia sp. CS682]|uniref:hypothetical protein n=1 Tax=Nocardia sp. CS682 TaxID=1047172 RepID=UPI001074EAB9|nr:hypothetical protein [Nocardia sp. CS682]QBS39010.1 hypothetical protein DMB37_01680 [Nocardia sp. CS682]